VIVCKYPAVFNDYTKKQVGSSGWNADIITSVHFKGDIFSHLLDGINRAVRRNDMGHKKRMQRVVKSAGRLFWNFRPADIDCDLNSFNYSRCLAKINDGVSDPLLPLFHV